MANRRRAGFTIVELMVTIVVLVILTTLVVVRLGSTQTSGRDQERDIDTATIAAGLESYYESGNEILMVPKGYYPGGTQVDTARQTSPPFKEFLEGVSKISLEAPDRTLGDSFGVDPAGARGVDNTNANTADGSYGDIQARTLLLTYPYLYQPLRRDNTFCTNYADCVKFNLYFLKESTDTVVRIRSKNQ